jgi:hypothetical protein
MGAAPDRIMRAVIEDARSSSGGLCWLAWIVSPVMAK